MPSKLASKLLEWYRGCARRMPWRDFPQPYTTWVSEIMLQQTQVETVIPYYDRWLTRFPTLADLAAASEEDVLRLWEGLGYYSRARNLHKAARLVMEKYLGLIPSNAAELACLPGIGRYTAGAIASIAFGQDEAALDGNIRRVFSRLFNVELPLRSPASERLLWELAWENLPTGQAGDYNQALMDLGATICIPKNPTCVVCPLADLCQAHQLGVEGQRPVTNPRPPVPHVIVTAGVIQRNDKTLIARRPPKGLLGGLWEFPGGKKEDGEDLPACLRREIQEELGVNVLIGAPLGVYHHAYTHFRVTLTAFFSTLESGEPQALHATQIAWVGLDDLATYPMGKIDRWIARDLKINQKPVISVNDSDAERADL